MSNTFKIKSALIPAKARAAALQGSTVSGSVSVVQSIGVKNENAAQVVNNYITNNYTTEDTSKLIKGALTITAFAALTDDDVQELDIYQVFSSGSEAGGWSYDNLFEYEGETYPDGTFFQRRNFVWVKMDKEEIDLSDTLKFNPIQKEVYFIEGLYSDSSTPMLSGAGFNGLNIAKVQAYEQDETGVFVQKYTTSGGTRPQRTNKHIISVPYACKVAKEGGGVEYKPGLLTAADYKKLSEASGAGVVIDTELTENVTNEHAAGSKAVWDKLVIFGQGISGLYSSKANADELNKYVTKTNFETELTTNYYTKAVIDTAFAAIKKPKYIRLKKTYNGDWVKDSAYEIDFISSLTSDGALALQVQGVDTLAGYNDVLVKYRISLMNVGLNGSNQVQQKKNIDYGIYTSEEGGTPHIVVSVNLSIFITAKETFPTYLVVSFENFD